MKEELAEIFHVMPSSQIKREPDDFFQLPRFKDFRHRPGTARTVCSSSHKSNGHRTAVSSKMPCMHFSVQRDTRRRPAGHRAATGRRPDGARTNTCRTLCRRRATVQSPSGRRTIYTIICVQPFLRNRHIN